ncbi:NAD(P)H-dependent oxidoreductase [Acidobacteria bacterium AB60]|nr:NAD(P)H-dependent oxidoreductase [Acidobacteria bacterium AB60]
MSHTLRVGVIYGSTRPGRFCDTVVRWVAGQIRAGGKFEVDLIDPATEGAAAVKEQLGRADAFLVVTPEYNHGYTAPLKALIDANGVEWHAKPVAFVSYGGVSGGLRAVEQLRLVFAELHAMTVRDSVSFAGVWEQFDAEGALKSPERAQRSMGTMLKRLHWWAVALRNARAAEPYTQVA